MEKDYEIIQNVSLAEVKEVEPQEAPTTAAVEAVEPKVEEPAVIETPEVSVEVEQPTIDIPSIEIPNIELPPEISPVEASETSVEPEVTQQEENYSEPSYTDESSNVNIDYSSMFMNNTNEAVPYENSYETDNSYTSEVNFNNTSYGVSGVEELDIDYKDEDSINRYYDQKTQKTINEIEKERTAALDQCKRYNEMSTWVNEIGSSFNFFKGRSGY